MKKFVITEDERKKILGLYEQAQTPQFSQFTTDMANIYGIPAEEMSYLESYNTSLDAETRKKYFDLAPQQLQKVAYKIADAARKGNVDNIMSSLTSYSKSITPEQKTFLDNQVSFLQTHKPMYDKFKGYTDEDWGKITQRLDGVKQRIGQLGGNTQPTETTPESQPTNDTSTQQGEKINTTNDRSYDYKLSNGKYYYSTKGQNKWIEAKGKGLEAIKSKVQF
jgi:hypothetical protein